MKKKIIKQPKMTLDKLAQLTQRGFLDIDKRFDGVDKRFNGIDKRFDIVENRLSELEEMFYDLQGAVDSYAKRADTYFQEMVMLSHQINRHEKWIRKIAEKVGVKLES